MLVKFRIFAFIVKINFFSDTRNCILQNWMYCWDGNLLFPIAFWKLIWFCHEGFILWLFIYLIKFEHWWVYFLMFGAVLRWIQYSFLYDTTTIYYFRYRCIVIKFTSGILEFQEFCKRLLCTYLNEMFTS